MAPILFAFVDLKDGISLLAFVSIVLVISAFLLNVHLFRYLQRWRVADIWTLAMGIPNPNFRFFVHLFLCILFICECALAYLGISVGRNFCISYANTWVDNEHDFQGSHPWGVRPDRHFHFARFPLIFCQPHR